MDIGRWLNINGEAIYGTRPWKVYGEGPTKVKGGAFHDAATSPYTAEDIRFTAKGDVLYAIALGWPVDGQLTIKSLAQGSPNGSAGIGEIGLVGSKAEIRWTRDQAGVHLKLPVQKSGEHAYVFKISQ